MNKKISKDDSKKLVREWRKHLQNSRLTEQQQIKRAKEFTRKGMKPSDTTRNS